MLPRIRLLLACWVVFVPLAAEAACQAHSGPKVLPLVELYTAEGCNDCPPADAWLARAAKSDPQSGAAYLAFHVDYWDEIGWHDRFGAELHTQRQKLKTLLNGGKRTIYTPQVMVGNEIRAPWREKPRFTRLLDTVRSRDAEVSIGAAAKIEADRLLVSLDATPTAGAGNGKPVWLWLALYEDGLSTQIEAGENKGKLLRHDRVVRFLQGPWKLPQGQWKQVVAVPLHGIDIGKSGLVVFAETSNDTALLQSLQLPLAACGTSG